MKIFSRHGFVSVSAILLLLCLTPATVASATETLTSTSENQSTQRNNSTITSENDLGLLATPTEMEQLGASGEDIETQAALFDALSPAQLSSQDQLREAQATEAQRLASLPNIAVSTAPLGSTMKRTGPSTDIYVTVCWPNNDYYSVFWSAGVDCFADSGTWYANPLMDNTTAVRPGNNVGRVYYPYGAYWYWSPWRGKTMDTYYFSGPITAYRVQIQ